MKKSNTDIVNHVKNVITEKKSRKLPELQNADLEIVKEKKIEEQSHNIKIDDEIQKWIHLNAEKICKEIVREEVKKIFK